VQLLLDERRSLDGIYDVSPLWQRASDQQVRREQQHEQHADTQR
jgi:hypothetical protein